MTLHQLLQLCSIQCVIRTINCKSGWKTNGQLWLFEQNMEYMEMKIAVCKTDAYINKVNCKTMNQV
jgi:hypothetical protein